MTNSLTACINNLDLIYSYNRLPYYLSFSPNNTIDKIIANLSCRKSNFLFAKRRIFCLLKFLI
ncbi:hypothetical protein A1OE_33 [Candidatus Endolissoclinum faulkneri L2]|uniref:Uncharacterized protein n=1 Tax=Candidatus Endolissoclinum faulkneri L2 TaxID=1193729 RepID=K7YL85_9PROT|nr:hypothetical protein A1OE_33 [Candidatus Endolissoclinum faulkneri L2]